MEAKSNPNIQSTQKEQEQTVQEQESEPLSYVSQFLAEMQEHEFSKSEWENSYRYSRMKVHFGQSFLFYSLIERSGLLALLNTIGIEQEDRDTFLSLLFFIALIPHLWIIEDWWINDLASCLFPKANLKAENLARLFTILSDKRVQLDFFKNWIQWVQHLYPGEKVRLIGGEIFNEDHPKRDRYFINYYHEAEPVSTQMILAVGEKSGLPYYYAICDPNEEDFSREEFKQILDDLEALSIPISYAVFNMVGSDPSIFNVFFDTNHNPRFDFTIELTPNHPYLKENIAKYREELEKDENLVDYEQELYRSASLSTSLDQEGKNQTSCTLVMNQGALDRIAGQRHKTRLEEEPNWLDVLAEHEFDGCAVFFTSKKRPVKTILNRYHQRKYLNQIYFIQDVFTKFESTDFDPVLTFLSIIVGGLWGHIAKIFQQAGMRLESRLPDLEDLTAWVDENGLKTYGLFPSQKEIFQKLDLKYPRTVKLDDQNQLIFPQKRRKKHS